MLIGKGAPADQIAAIMADGSAALSWGDLRSRSVRMAHGLRAAGLKPGDRVAILLENTVEWFPAVLGIRRAGMLFVPVNWHLKPREIRYVLENSDARAILAGESLADLAGDAIGDLPAIALRLTTGDARRGFRNLATMVSAFSEMPPDQEFDGGAMLYSSGTSGKPKGIIRTRAQMPFGTPTAVELLLTTLYGLDHDTIYLCPAPLYHAAPIGWTVSVLLAGGTVVVMPRFSPAQTMEAIQRHCITHVQFVPTHMIRLLKMPEDDRTSFDLSSLKMVVHAAAPCPPEVKRRTIEWLGPIVQEYYSGSEGCGFTEIDSKDWLTHPGSVGRSRRGPIHIIDPNTRAELPVGEIGLVFFELGEKFEYHKDKAKTEACFSPQGWGTHGDLGRVDADGYLYLADRMTNLVISGGVNIYPQEVENVLVTHPAVLDVAAIGVPDEDLGEALKAVVELTEEARALPPAAAELIAYCKAALADFKCPRTVDFVDALPRHPNGKLLKRELKSRYWPEAAPV